MNKKVRIGTRDSRLALWQAELVSRKLNEAGYDTALILIKSDGDINLTTPLYELGVQGIFTKVLDAALLEKKIDIAVHSYKDVPTMPAKGLMIAAVLERASHADMLIHKEGVSIPDERTPMSFVIATSSIRRKAQWLHRFPGSIIENLRGNVNTRIKKVHEANWHGAIFAAAGIDRLGLTIEETGPRQVLHWMIPAPAQGAIAVACNEHDEAMKEACSILNHTDTAICTKAERDFLRFLQGGCSTPISAYAFIKDEHLYFKGNVTSPDGTVSLTVNINSNVNDEGIAGKAAKEIMEKGAGKLISI
jgi:hydroxymethylbilane synthase